MKQPKVQCRLCGNYETWRLGKGHKSNPKYYCKLCKKTLVINITRKTTEQKEAYIEESKKYKNISQAARALNLHVANLWRWILEDKERKRKEILKRK